MSSWMSVLLPTPSYTHPFLSTHKELNWLTDHISEKADNHPAVPSQT